VKIAGPLPYLGGGGERGDDGPRLESQRQGTDRGLEDSLGE